MGVQCILHTHENMGGKLAMKKVVSYILILAILISGIFCGDPIDVHAEAVADNYDLDIDRAETSSKNNLKSIQSLQTKRNNKDNNKSASKAYKKYYEKNLSDSCDYYILADLNKDGMKEMIAVSVGGARAAMYIYSYHNGNVVKCTDDFFFNDLGYMKKGKKFAGRVNDGAAYTATYLCKISKGKLKIIDIYVYDNDVYRKNGKKISADEYWKVDASIDWSKYYSYKQYASIASL